MYQLEYLDLEENNTYEEIIKKVVEQCFKEEKLEQRELEQELILHTIMYMERQDQQNITARKIPTHGLSDVPKEAGKRS